MIMLCTKCKSDATTVIATEQKPLFRRRRYKCLICGERFNTREIVMASKSSNADRIRAMSDDELAKFIMYGFSADSYGVLIHDKTLFFTTNDVLEWLEEPAEGE
jgi:hypothetical protein